MSTDGNAIEAAARAVLHELGWPDDRNTSAHIEPDGYQVTAPGCYWDIAQGVAQAVIAAIEPTLRADERAKTAEEIARAIEGAHHERLGCCECVVDAERHAAIARQHATRPAESAPGATQGPDAYPSEGDGSEGESGRLPGGPVLPPQRYRYDPAVDGPIEYPGGQR